MSQPSTDTPPFETESGLLDVTEEMAEGVRKFIAALKPGLYVKCTTCHKLKVGINSQGTSGFFKDDKGFYCKECV